MLVSLLLRPLPALEPSERESEREESPPPDDFLPDSRSELRPLAMAQSNIEGPRNPTPIGRTSWMTLADGFAKQVSRLFPRPCPGGGTGRHAWFRSTFRKVVQVQVLSRVPKQRPTPLGRFCFVCLCRFAGPRPAPLLFGIAKKIGERARKDWEPHLGLVISMES